MRITLHCAVAFGVAISSSAAQQKSAPTPLADAVTDRSYNPELLSFDELVALASTAKPEGALAARLDALLNTPFVHSETAPSDIQPHRPSVSGLGAVLRVGLWNIERGLNFDLIRSALTDPGEFSRLSKSLDRVSPRQKEIIESQLAMLQGVDVLFLNEADWGMKTN